ncbi:MAG TPA: vanadium-dependent haloperoxidase [Methylomirabilota bacterium]|nr:vanadium-dependent haloperoxidase [Methylomirabilota bacterium]
MRALSILIVSLVLGIVANGASASTQTLLRWNRIAVDASGLDHTPVAPGEDRVFGEQLGPCRSSRAMAIVHIAMFDSMASVMGGWRSYTGVQAPSGPSSLDAAISQAAHDTLAALFPSQAETLGLRLAEDLAEIDEGSGRENGMDLGQRVAAAILTLKSNDGSEKPDPEMGVEHITSDLPGRWRQDPVSLMPIALGAYWGECVPFVLESSSQFRAPPPPDISSPEYAAAYDDAKRLGGDGVVTSTTRTAEQTRIGVYWAYDGTPSLCAPPRLYNQIAIHIADGMGTEGIELARLLALANVAMADAGMAVWESKYLYDYWRPVIGIREADPGTGPTGAGDGNPDTAGDPEFLPLGAPATNLQGPNFTPPFPAYPSGHAGFGGALFQTLRHFYGTDDIPFTFVSDEFNGVTLDNEGNPRPLLPRSFTSLSQAEEENGQSRIYLGIHWSFDKTEGIIQGRQVADYVFANALTPIPVIELSGVEGDTVTLRWKTFAGQRYQLEYRDRLGKGAWLPLGPEVSGDGSTVSTTDSPLQAHRFYRLLLLD